MHISMSSRQRRVEEAGHRPGFDIFQKFAVKFSTLGKYNWNSPPREMICGHRHEQKFKYPYLQAKAIDQIPALYPASPPTGLTLIGA